MIATLVAFSFAAKSGSGKVRSAIGEVTRQKNGAGEFTQLKVGNKVSQGDNIRTLLESQAIIALPDGSVFSIEENSLVSMTELLSEDGVNTITAEIKSGKIRFDAQKQKNKESQFKFKTGTATAAIRGTEGVIGVTPLGQFIASLRSGSLDIGSATQNINIVAGQVVYSRGDQLVVLKASGAGDLGFMNTLIEIISDTTSSADSINALIDKASKDYEAILQEVIANTAACEFKDIPDTTHVPSLTITAKCTENIGLEIGGVIQQSNGSDMQFNTSWMPGSFGEKKFPVTCHKNRVSFPCATIATYYDEEIKADTTTQDTTPQPLLTLNTTSAGEICRPAALTIEGTFDTSDPDATLYVTVGNTTSPNLVPLSVGGKFFTTISISDNENNWNESRATVAFSSKKGNATEVVDFSVNKSCQEVNLLPPKLSITSIDNTSCYVKLALSQSDDDIVQYTASVDGDASIQTNYNGNSQITQSLTSGEHNYTFTAVDLAGNTASISQSLGCYPTSAIGIELDGGRIERLRVPPPPGNIKQEFYKMLRFKVTNVPQNDPTHIKQITIKQDNNAPIVMHPTDLQSTTIDTQIKLVRGTKSNITITVTMKNGRIITATKTYEAR